MAATFYHAGNSDSDAVRFLVGDTNIEYPLVQDEDIQTFLDFYPKETGKPPYLAAAEVCDAIVMKLSSLPTREKIGSTDVTYGERATEARKTAKLLRQKANDSASPVIAAPGYAGGISVADKETRADKADNVKPAFTRGQFGYAN